MLTRISLRGRILLFFVALAAGALAALAVGMWFGYHRAGSPDMLTAFIQSAIAAGFLILAIVTWIWFLFDTHLARPIARVASAMRARAHANVAHDFREEEARYLGELAEAASATAATLAQTRGALAEQVQRETTRLSSDKSKLEQLLADVPPAVLLCTGRHHIVFYNGVAQHLLSGSSRPVCLDRNVFDYLSEGPIRTAHHRLLESAEPDAIVEFLCLGPCGRRRLAGRMRLAGDNGGDQAAYVMTLRDVTTEVAAHAGRDALLGDVFALVRPIVSELRRLAGAHDLDMIAGDEVSPPLRRLETNLAELETRFERLRSDGWPMAAEHAREIARLLQRELDRRTRSLDIDVADIALRCNAFDIVSLMAHLIDRISETKEAADYRLSVAPVEGAAEVALSWQGGSVCPDELKTWLDEPVFESGATGEAILLAHGAAALAVRADEAPSISIRLQLSEQHAHGADVSRHVVYNFELLSRIHDEKLADARLDALTYVVFDTETTGLLPEQGDEMVQIAAVRIVNGKRIGSEVFNLLINPGRAIPRSATAIHGVTDAMVLDAVSVREAVRQFHLFAEGAVLVAHNAPFDMEFLTRRERELGLRFVNPILDTVLLSASAFGRAETHTLDALADRLGVRIEQRDRHTALGDAIATADIFIKLKDMLAGQGLVRFGDVLTKLRSHQRLVRDLNDRHVR
ncbi:exonuclease domain-containing protein [Rhizobium sp. TRM95796]|uniref:3'-5' exonuclease n=1 Tax=Rhizobium sp. TRM95796 TaxID=2979862 RepID=UPI0021E99D33|nr:exonuclease domain-containing protein [Rhizobium sp. TRM95796]MCV3768017.1 exonuclease domain-containing protein [Rhizobium sp. TRM95796]